MHATSSTPDPQRKPLTGDERLDEWQPLLSAWWNRFHDEPVTVDELRVALLLDLECSDAFIPPSLQWAQHRGPGALKRSLGRRLAALVGWTIGRFVVSDGGRDSRHNVREWRLQLAGPEVTRD
jgi:hypothetical protein